MEKGGVRSWIPVESLLTHSSTFEIMLASSISMSMKTESLTIA